MAKETKKSYSSNTFVTQALNQIKQLPGVELTAGEEKKIRASLGTIYSTNKNQFQKVTTTTYRNRLANYAGSIMGYQTKWTTDGKLDFATTATGARQVYSYNGITPKYNTLPKLRGISVNQYAESARMIFVQNGMGDIAKALDKIMLTTLNPIEAHQLLTQTDAYKQRFSGMTLRAKNGLAPIDEASYLQIENGYKQVMNSYGLPKDWTTPEKMADFIGKDISVQEMNQRAQVAYDWSQTRDPNLKAALKTYYNIDDSHLVGYALDPQATIADIEKQNKAAQIGATAVANQFGVPTTNPNDALAMGNYFKSLTDQGVSAGQAGQAFGQTMASNSTVNALTSTDLGMLTGGALTQQQQASAALGLDANAKLKLTKLGAAEKALYSGSNAGTGVIGNETATSLASGLF
jgi:hypothetical protein